MNTNDFRAASNWLAEDFVCVWPQSNEIIRGRENFTAINQAYPAEGKWRFDVQEIVVDGNRVVSDVLVTDGNIKARAITFHNVSNGLIRSQKEFWPDEFAAPDWRSQWVNLPAPKPQGNQKSELKNYENP